MKNTRRISPVSLALAAGTALALASTALAQPQLLKDINPGAPTATGGSFPNALTQISNNLIYFAATDAVNGTELWRTDGTPAGTTIIADFNPGIAAGPIEIGVGGGVLVPYLKFAVTSGNRLFFFGQSPSFGYELCITDGTALGTTLVRDIAAGASFGITGGPNGVLFGTNLRELDVALVTINNLGYVGATNLIDGSELWVSDGTFAGTQPVVAGAGICVGPPPTGSPISQTSGSFGGRMYTVTPDNKLIFVARDGQTLSDTGGTVNGSINGNELFIYDPSQPVVYNAPSIANPGANAIGNPKRMSDRNGANGGVQFWHTPTIVDNFVYWMGVNTGGTADQMWRTNWAAFNPAIDQTNTAANVADRLTEQATQIGTIGSTPLRVQFDPVAIGTGTTARVFFIANAGDNLTTRLFLTRPSDPQPNATAVSALGIFPRRGVNVNDRLVYWANSGNGSLTGTNVRQPAFPGAPERGWELYSTDGIAGIGGSTDYLLREYNPGPANGAATVVPTIELGAANNQTLVWPTYIYVKNGKAWFGASTIGANPAMVAPFTAANNDTGGPSQASNAATTAVQPFFSDGTPTGTPAAPFAILAPLGGPITAGQNANIFAVERLNATTVMFSGFSPANGRELWATNSVNPSQANTTLVKDIAVTYTDSGVALWTAMPNSYGDGSGISETKILQNRVFFNAFNATSGRELWTAVAVPSSLGATADSTTVQVAEINAGPNGSNPGNLTPVETANGWRLFFGATDSAPNQTVTGSGYEVWSLTLDPFTGAVNAPAQVADLFPGRGNGFPVVTPANLLITLNPLGASVGGQFLFMGLADPTDTTGVGRELYATDGVSPPVLVRDVNPVVTTGTAPVLDSAGPSLGFMPDNRANDWAGGVAPSQFRKLTATTNAGFANNIVYAAVDSVTSTDVAPPTGTTPNAGVAEPAKSDGTFAGTITIADINPGGGSGPINFAEIPPTGFHPQGAIIFYANDGITGLEPWVFDIASGTASQIADINPALGVGSNAGVPFTVTSNGYAVFSASDGTTGTEVYVYNGNTGTLTGAFNNAAFNINLGAGGAASSFPGPYFRLTDFNGGPDKILFDANDGVNGYELYEFIPNQPYVAGVNPRLLVPGGLNPGLGDGIGGNYAVGGDPVTGPGNMGFWLYFDGNDGTRGFEPWRYNGRDNLVGDYPFGTGLEFLGDINPGPFSSNPDTFFVDSTVFAQIVYFMAFKPETTAPFTASGDEPHFFVTKCGPADISFIGGDVSDLTNKAAYYPPDGQLTVDDIIVFFNAFGSGCDPVLNNYPRCNPADITGIGGPVDSGTGTLVPPDSQLTVDDIIAFINAFGSGC